MKLYELAYACKVYAAFTNFDSALGELRRVTGQELDLLNPARRKDLLNWLNSWGCRQFARQHHGMASDALLDWARHYLVRLAPHKAGLADLRDSALDAAAEVYGDLRDRSASKKSRKGRSWKVTFGATGAAKVLYAMRPNAFPPWDDAIRKHFRYDSSGEAYRQFLGSVRDEVRGLKDEAMRLGMRPGDIPAAVGRPESSLPKLVDEYRWVTIAKRLPVMTGEELERWTGWWRAISR